jgi:uncharacterized protein (DUF983 family)
MSQSPPSLSPFLTGFQCRCPRCGKGRLFAGFLTPAKACDVCGLDFAFAENSDGPAIFIIFIAGAIIMAMALIVDAAFKPPVFVHLLIWIPATVALCLVLLRPFKATIIALQYRHNPGEDRF